MPVVGLCVGIGRREGCMEDMEHTWRGAKFAQPILPFVLCRGLLVTNGRCQEILTQHCLAPEWLKFFESSSTSVPHPQKNDNNKQQQQYFGSGKVENSLHLDIGGNLDRTVWGVSGQAVWSVLVSTDYPFKNWGGCGFVNSKHILANLMLTVCLPWFPDWLDFGCLCLWQ